MEKEHVRDALQGIVGKKNVLWKDVDLTVYSYDAGLVKGKAAVSYKGKMVDTPVYDNARTILTILAEIEAFDKKRKG